VVVKRPINEARHATYLELMPKLRMFGAIPPLRVCLREFYRPSL